jgi:hypothetical protein
MARMIGDYPAFISGIRVIRGQKFGGLGITAAWQ